MNHKFSSLQQVLGLFLEKEFWGVTEMAHELGKSTVLVHRYLKELEKQGKVQKNGSPPKTTYSLVGKSGVTKEGEYVAKQTPEHIILNIKTREILKKYFYKYAPDGYLYEGENGFFKWCTTRGLNIEKTAENFFHVAQNIKNITDECGMLSASTQFGTHFEEKYLDSVYYADQYIWLEFGRGKLAEMTFYAKQSQNRELILKSISEISFQLRCKIAQEKYDAIAITPWSIERKNQLLLILKKELEKNNIPFIQLEKYFPNAIPIPQKSLKKTSDRIKNAQNTIFVHDSNIQQYKKVLLIDDFVGSGATLNETAKKLKAEGIEQVDGFAFVGNLDLSYDVINEI